MHDYHIHSHWCRHASGRLDEYAAAAVAAGIDEVCFTPHIPLPGFRPGFFNDRVRMDIGQFADYEQELALTRARFPGLSILGGIEADYIAGMEGFVEGFLSEHELDFVLMSVHFVAGWPGESWAYELPRDRPLERIYREYLRCVREGIATGLYDSVAHLDLIKQPDAPFLASARDEVDQILGLCRERGMSMEVNTSGARKKIAESYPGPDIVRLALEAGVSLTPGSDAHTPSQLGSGFELLDGAGRRDIAAAMVRYRRREALPLDAADQAFCSMKLK